MNIRHQTIPKAQRYTVKQFNEQFPDDLSCLEFMMEQRWPGGVAFCHKCEKDRKHYNIKGRTAFVCPSCGNHIYPLAGTIFHKSTTSLKTWFYVMHLMSTTRAGVSAKQIQRATGVTYKTAWRMMKQIRMLMDEQIRLKGEMEMDEGYFGGNESNKPLHLRSNGRASKTSVLGLVERGGNVVAKVMPDSKKDSIVAVVGEVVEPNATFYTDEGHVLKNVRWMGQGHAHETVKHATGHRKGLAHTNSIEGFWSLVKRGISGVYYKVGPDYLQSYLNEYAFRYNRRKVMRPMFKLLAERGVIQVCPSAYEAKRLA